MCLRPRLSGWLDAAGMSKARLVITAVTVEKRPVSEVARSYGPAVLLIAARRPDPGHCQLIAAVPAGGPAAARRAVRGWSGVMDSSS